MNNPPYGNPAELDAYHATLKVGDQVTKANLRALQSLAEADIKQMRSVISHFEKEGLYVRGEGNGIFYKEVPAAKPELDIGKLSFLPSEGGPTTVGERYPKSPFQPEVGEIGDETTEQEKIPYQFHSDPRLERLREIAYEFFDPHPTIFRGIVVNKAGYNEKKERHDKTGVDIIASNGTVKFGIVSPDESTDYVEINTPWFHRRLRVSDRTKRLRNIANEMEKDHAVLVRYTGEFTGKSGKPTWLFEPLISISEDDHVTLDGNQISTEVTEEKILHLPIVEIGKPKYGVVNGVGYIEIDDDLVPVFVDGAGDKVGNILQEVGIRSKKEIHGNTRFFIAETQITPEEKIRYEFRKIDNAIAYIQGCIDSMELYHATDGDHDNGIPKIGRVYKDTLRLSKIASEVGFSYQYKTRREKIKYLMSRIAAMMVMVKREKDAISNLYSEGSDAYENLMSEWPAMIDKYLDQLKIKGRFRESILFGSVDEQKERKKVSMLMYSPLFEMLEAGIFNMNTIKCLDGNPEFHQYLAAVNSAFDFAADKVNASHNWHGQSWDEIDFGNVS